MKTRLILKKIDRQRSLWNTTLYGYRFSSRARKYTTYHYQFITRNVVVYRSFTFSFLRIRVVKHGFFYYHREHTIDELIGLTYT